MWTRLLPVWNSWPSLSRWAETIGRHDAQNLLKMSRLSLSMTQNEKKKHNNHSDTSTGSKKNSTAMMSWYELRVLYRQDPT